MNAKVIVILGVFFASLLFNITADAAPCSSGATACTAASGALPDMQAAVDNIAPGGIINVPAGSWIWTGTLIITKGISLIGAGQGNTVISGNNRGEENYLISFSPVTTTDLFRVSGFTFNITNQQGIQLLNNSIYPPVDKVRIDNNRFTNSSIARAAIKNWGTRGVIDNNTFDHMRYPLGMGWGGAPGGSGVWDWTHFPDLVYGANNDNMYVEDNTFTEVTTALSDADQGGRYVFRYNNIAAGSMYPLLDTHGGRGGLYGAMGAEVYGNNITGNGFLISQQGGGRVSAHHNVLSGGGSVNMYVNAGCPALARERMNNSYHFLNRQGVAGALIKASSSGGDNCGDVVVENSTFWMDDPQSSGAAGVGSGPLMDRPAACTPGAGYWATDQSVTSLAGMVGVNPATPVSGTLYQCTAPNTWSAFYSPLTYPHPLRADVAQGLQGWWTLDEGAGAVAADSSGKNGIGTLQGTAATWVSGNVGLGALVFNGVDQYIDAGTNTILAGGPALTISAWIKPAARSGYITSRKAGWAMSWELFLSQGQVKFALATSSGPNPSMTLASAGVINTNGNTWTHVAATYSTADGSLRLYINGKLDGTAVLGSPIYAPAAIKTLIGVNAKDLSGLFKGGMDDIRIYNKALAPFEVLALFNQGKEQGNPANTYYVDFDAGRDDNSGLSSSLPWQHAPGDVNAQDHAGATILFPGDVVRFKGGTHYTGTVRITRSGLAGTPITYDGNSDNTWGTGKAVMDGKKDPLLKAAFISDGASSDIIIQGFEIVHFGGYPDNDPVFMQTCLNPVNTGIGGTGISFASGGQRLVFKNMFIHELGEWHNQPPFTAGAIGGMGIFINNTHHVLIDTVEFTKIHTAIEVSTGSVSTTNIEIKNVDIHNYIVWGIDIPVTTGNVALENITIHDSKFHDYAEYNGDSWQGCGEWPHTDGIFVRRDYHPITQVSPVRIYNNMFYSTSPLGVGGTASIYVTEGPSAFIYNNIFMGTISGRTISVGPGPHAGDSLQVVRIYNNTYFNSQTAVNLAGTAACPLGFISIKNNIFYDTTTGSGNNFSIFLENAYANINELDYNMHRSLNRVNSLLRWDGGGGEYSLARLRIDKGFEAHGFQGDPQFRDISYGLFNPLSLQNDLRLKAGSPAIGAGEDLSAYIGNFDRNNLARPQGAPWDVGAYQFFPIDSGDISGDGRVTMYDAALVLKYTVGGPLTSVQQAQADINGDTKVDAADALAIARKALALE